MLDTEGGMLGNVEVLRVRTDEHADCALLVRVEPIARTAGWGRIWIDFKK